MLRLAFEGTSDPADSASTYLQDAVDLQIRVLDLPRPPLGKALDQSLNGARRTVVVAVHSDTDSVFVDSQGLRDRVTQAGGRDVLVKLPKPPADDSKQQSTDPDAIEPALLPVTTALRAMETARQVLQNLVGGGSVDQASTGHLRLFLSHAKIDGVPVALSLASILRRFQRASQHDDFGYFYDVEHIEAGDDWQETLEDAAKRSVLIALRTEEYEKRLWCQKEYLWAESNRMPILVVDLRTDTRRDSALLPFDAAPAVHVHDGNLIRVVFHALGCHLRMLRTLCQARDDDVILPHKPTTYSLHAVCQALKPRGPNKRARIAYPTPPLPVEYADSVRPILQMHETEIALVTHDEIDDTGTT